MKVTITRFSAVLCFVFLAVVSWAADYARPELLIEPEEVRALIESRQEGPYASRPVVCLDVRNLEAHREGSLAPGRRVDASAWKQAFTEEDAASWSGRLSRLGVTANTLVVVYDEGVTPTAARVWWILKYWGVENAAILNGGIGAWRKAGAPVYRSPRDLVASSAKTGAFVAEPHPERLATANKLLSLDSASTCLIDTRTDREVSQGIIPNAEHADWVRFVDPATGKMRSADELKALLDAVGFDPDEPAIAYCRSGGRASVVAFAMELMGGKQVANYYGSWNEWSRLPDAPIAYPNAEGSR